MKEPNLVNGEIHGMTPQLVHLLIPALVVCFLFSQSSRILPLTLYFSSLGFP